MGGSQSGQHRQQTEEKPMVARAASQAKIREHHGQHEQAVKQKTLIFQIMVNGFSDKLIVIKFECSQAKFDSTTTLELKEKIIAENLKGMETDSLRLVFASTPMEDEKTFSDYHIQNMSMVMMITRMPAIPMVKQKTQIFQIRVNGFSDKLIVIKFECSQAKFYSTTTLELKEKIIAEHLKGSGMETDSLRLVFASMPMEDEKTFSDYHIQNMSTVMMISRMPAGWKSQSVP